MLDGVVRLHHTGLFSILQGSETLLAQQVTSSSPDADQRQNTYVWPHIDCVMYLELVWQMHKAGAAGSVLALLQLLLQLFTGRQDSRKVDPSVQQLSVVGACFQGG